MTKKKIYLSVTVGLVILVSISVCAFISVKDEDPDQAYRHLFLRYTRILAPEMPATASFANEEVPLDLYYVREAFDREMIASTFMHSTALMMFKRANRWFPVIEPILKKNGIPEDFKFLAVAESYLINAVSPAGAEGYWQFIKPTGHRYGLEINGKVDERYHMEKATQAACDYLNEAYRRFNSWTLVAASYNRGVDGLQRALDSQKASNYYNLYLNDETSRYLFRILAIKEVYNNPVKYGFMLREQDFYPVIPTRLVTVDSAISDLPAFAKTLNINYRILRELNPWIQDYSLPNSSGKRYSFSIPEEDGLSYTRLMKNVPVRDTFFHDTLKINETN